MKRLKPLWIPIIALASHVGGAFAADRVVNGVVVSPDAWPATVPIFENLALMGTGTLVGPRAMLTAAHVIDVRKPYLIKVAGTDYIAQCTRYPMYPQVDLNLALCLLDREVRGVVFESIDVNPTTAALGDTVAFVGYGAGSSEGGRDGVLRFGTSTIAGERAFEFVALNGAAAVGKDSGAAGYVVRSSGRSVVGVVSKGNTKDRTQFARVSSDLAISYFQSWSTKYRTPVCGIDPAATGCRPGSGSQPSSFRLENDVALVQVHLKPAFVASLTAIRESVRKALQSFLPSSEE